MRFPDAEAGNPLTVASPQVFAEPRTFRGIGPLRVGRSRVREGACTRGVSLPC
jgi:hypothetical protein